MRAGFGCLLMVVALVILFVFVVIPVLPPLAENRAIDDYLATVLCQPNESIIREQYSWTDNDGTSFSMDVFCQDVEEQREDVTGKWIAYGVVGFTAPFLIGVFALIAGARRRAVTPTFETDDFVTVGVTPQGVAASPGLYEVKDGVLRVGGIEIKMDGISPDRINTYQWGSAGADGEELSLTDKLKQIQEARDGGLITAEEYDRLRQSILDNMD